MVVNRKPSGTAKSMPVGLAIGWIVETLVTAATCMLLAILILNGKAGWVHFCLQRCCFLAESLIPCGSRHFLLWEAQPLLACCTVRKSKEKHAAGGEDDEKTSDFLYG